MNHCRRNPLSISLAVVFLVGLLLTSNAALCAAPVARALPAFTTGINTPVKIAADATSDNFFVADPVAGGVLKYGRDGNLLQRYLTSKSVTGVAIALNGNLLVTQGTYIEVINSNDGTAIPGKRFGAFGNASDITIDNVGNVYVADGLNNTITKFTYSGIGTNDYGTNYAGGTATVIVTSTTLKRPSAIAYEKTSPGFLYVSNGLTGTINIYSTAGGTPLKTIGSFGYQTNRVANTVPKFTYPQDITFEYDASNKLIRVYVADSYQGFVQVLDGTYTYSAPTLTGNFYYIADISSYGYENGHLFVPSSVLFDQKDTNNRRLFVANGAGSLAVFSIDNAMFPTNIQVGSRALNSLMLTWEKPTDSNFASVRIYRSTDGINFGVPIAVGQTNTSYLDSGLIAGTKYYYKVQAVDTSTTPVEYPNSLQVTGTTLYNYNLTLGALPLDVFASGQINGSASCAGASCISQIAEGTTVTLFASPNALTSVFAGWSGACAAFNIDSKACVITMNGDVSASASFASQDPYYVAGETFKTLQDAYAYAYTYDITEIRVMAGKWPAGDYGPMYAWYAPNTVKIKGGYDSEFVAQTAGNTVISGGMRLNAGKVILDRVRIGP